MLGWIYLCGLYQNAFGAQEPPHFTPAEGTGQQEMELSRLDRMGYVQAVGSESELRGLATGRFGEILLDSRTLATERLRADHGGRLS